MTPTQNKPGIVFCHGLWADGSCFSKLIVPLQAEGYECIAAQYGLNTTAEDVALVKATMGRVSGPVILVGHSYGGSVITGAGTDDRVTGLVYIAALAPDADETSQTQQSKFPKTDVFSHIEVVDGRIWLRPEGTKYFCGDLSEQEQKLVWATQGVPKPDLFEAKAGGTAWKSKPSCYIIGKNDRTVHPDLERFFAKRMSATTYELFSSHVPMLIGCGTHALGEETLQVRMHCAVVFADDVPARLRLPSGSPGFRLEQVRFGDALGRPNELLLLLRKVSAEILRALRTKPDTSIHDFNVGEDVGPREIDLLCLRRFIGVRSERADINQPGNAIIGSGAGNDASAVGVADEDNGAADPANRCFHQCDVPCRCIEAVLRCNTLIPLRLKGNDQLAEARTIGPESVAKHDAWFGLRRCHFLLLIDSFIFAFIYSPHFRTVMDDLPKSRLLNLLLVCLLSALLSQHPLPDVRRTAQYRDAGGLTLI